MQSLPAVGLAALAATILGGCASTHTLSVAPESTPAAISTAGRPWLSSTKRNTVGVCLLTPAYNTSLSELLPPAFLVVVRNRGDRPLNLSRDDITATAGGRAVRVLTSEDYQRVINREATQAQAAIWAQAQDLNGAIDDALVDRLTQAGGSLVSWRQAELLTDAANMLPATPQAVAPGRPFACVVRLQPSDLSRGQRLRLSVRVGGETHEFAYVVGG